MTIDILSGTFSSKPVFDGAIALLQFTHLREQHDELGCDRFHSQFTSLVVLDL